MNTDLDDAPANNLEYPERRRGTEDITEDLSSPELVSQSVSGNASQKFSVLDFRRWLSGGRNLGIHLEHAQNRLTTCSWSCVTPSRHKTYNVLPADEGAQSSGSRRQSKASWMTTWKDILLSSWANVLLVFVPAGIATGLARVPPLITFICNAVAVIPLSSLLAFATECIANDLGDTVGALMNISFGNLIEVIMFMIALVHDEVRVVQGALVGSILVNLLFILGTAIIVGEFQPLEMIYDMNNAQALACLLSLSVFSTLIPAAFHFTFQDEKAEQRAILTLSRASAIILLIVYAIYLTFLLRPRRRGTLLSDTESLPGRMLSFDNPISDITTTSRLSRTIRFADEHVDDNRGSKTTSGEDGPVEMETIESRIDSETSGSSDCGNEDPDQGSDYRRREQPSKKHLQDFPPVSSRGPSSSRSRSRSRSLSGTRHLRYTEIAERYGASSSTNDSQQFPAARTSIASSADRGEDYDIAYDSPAISRTSALVLLVATSLTVAICADFLVENIASITATSTLSESFIGLIVLPIAGNAAEQITAVTVAAKGKVDLAIGVSFGSSIQIALFVNPLMVIMGWILRKDMSLYFGLFETVTLVGAALLVNFLIWNGRTNYLEGSLLCACYVMIGVGAFLIP